MNVLVDKAEGDRAVARSAGDAPEIDGVVYVDGENNLRMGDFARIEITRSDAHDLWGREVS